MFSRKVVRGPFFRSAIQGAIAFIIVAFGQPSFLPWLGPFAAACGYALFWRAIAVYPFRRHQFVRGFFWYGAVSLVQLSWMSAIEYQGIYILLVWIAISVMLGIQFGCLSMLIPFNRSLTIARICAIASLWTLLEWSRFYFLCGYTWNLSGLSLSVPFAIQMGALFGVLGLSFWVILTNLFALKAFTKKRIPYYCLWVAVALVPYLFGALYLPYQKRSSKKNQIDAICGLIVQTGLLPDQKMLLENRMGAYISPYKQWKRILLLLKEWKGRRIDLILLPESAVPFSSHQKVYDLKRVEKIFVEVFGAAVREQFVDFSGDALCNLDWAQCISNIFRSELILGLDHVDKQGYNYNSAFHLEPSLSQTDLTLSKWDGVFRYDKRILMPLAEYLPLAALAPLVKHYGITHFFNRGTRAKIVGKKIPLSISICYEETFPHHVREGRLLGAQLLVGVSNDGWYPFSRLPSQHLEHARLRAVENGVPLLRACNTGISAAIDGKGSTICALGTGKKETGPQSGALFFEFPLEKYDPPFLIWGNWAIVAISGACLVGFISFKKKFIL